MELLPNFEDIETADTTEQQSPPVPEWSITSGDYDPNNPYQVPDLERVSQIEESVRMWHGDAKYRFWAREILAYAIELSGIKFGNNPTIGESVDHALNEDFAQAVKALLKPGESDGQLPDAPGEVVEHSAVMQGVKAIVRSTHELSVDYHAANAVESLSRNMVRLRLAKEIKHSESE